MSEETLLEMLDITVNFLNEQEACYYCIHRNVPSDCVQNNDYCKSGIFNGIQRMAERNLKDKKNETI
ncbi:MAG: hypothetical protein KHX03_09785 [Clostridium sp.]|nr:hypothetical protein [Clostridium sp.]